MIQGILATGAAALAVVTAASAATAHVPQPSKATDQLFAVTCLASGDCWAVGQYAGEKHTLAQVLHLSRGQWRKVAFPQAAGKIYQRTLTGITCPSVRDCWAGGYDSNAGAVKVTAMLHWNGRQWSRVSVPDPGGTSNDRGDENVLSAVTCVSTRDCWAVGFYEPKSRDTLDHDLTLHWNGRRWAKVPTQRVGGSRAGDELAGVTCPSARDCWAVGTRTSVNNDAQVQALHWNGRSWKSVHAPDPSGNAMPNEVAAVSCRSSTDCWAVGSYETRRNYTRPLALHWAGHGWKAIRAPDPAGSGQTNASALLAVTCGRAAGCWAAGYSYRIQPRQPWPGRNLLLHFAAGRWHRYRSPDRTRFSGEASSVLDGITCPAEHHCQAVGYFTTGYGGYELRNQILRWHGGRWRTG